MIHTYIYTRDRQHQSTMMARKSVHHQTDCSPTRRTALLLAYIYRAVSECNKHQRFQWHHYSSNRHGLPLEASHTKAWRFRTTPRPKSYRHSSSSSVKGNTHGKTTGGRQGCGTNTNWRKWPMNGASSDKNTLGHHHLRGERSKFPINFSSRPKEKNKTKKIETKTRTDSEQHQHSVTPYISQAYNTKQGSVCMF